MRLKGFCLALLLLAGCDRAPDPSAQAAVEKAANPAFSERWQYPREREVDGRRVIVHAPQVRTWPNFEHFTAQVAIEFVEKDADAEYGVVDLSGNTSVDRKARLVKVAKPKVDRIVFTEGGSTEQEDRIRTAVESEPLEIPLDVFLYYLADGVLESAAPAGFNNDPPPIHVVESPAFLLFVNGKEVITKIGDTGLEIIGNANFPTFRDTQGGKLYLLTGDHRYSAAQLAGPWTAITELPVAFGKIPARGEFASMATLVATAPKAGAAPWVITTFEPAEIIVLEGKPRGQAIPGTGGLESIVNTESPLFRLDGTYYLLAAGRWFSTRNLVQGPWKFTMPLPDAFARIPEDDAMADVRASVPGTLEARRATLEATLPEKKIAKAGAAPAVTVSYAGEPKFEPVPATEVARAVNTGNDIIQYGDKYYLCYEGMWYVAPKPTGPWAATADVPAAIYEIPPSSPSYPVTQVVVVTTDDGDVESSYNGAYAAGMFIGFGVAYYGTGYYYPPYYYGGYYYPYYGSYGHGSWYNPNTGGYGSRSVWYGPYGGYSYNQGYNPRTGRSSYVETAWDGDEWASSGGTYNPRTGISTETDRYYSEDSNKMKMERTVEGPGGGSMDVKKTTDFDTGTRTTERETERGGSSEVTRQREADGSISKSGTIETAGGKSATIEGERQGGKSSTTITGEGGGSGTVDRQRNADGSVSREGSFSKDGQTVNTETRRDGTSSVTKAEGSGGGKAISASGGIGDRTTIAQSGSGDLYAGHDGEVYRKTDDGWQKHDDGGWQDMETPDRPNAGEGGGNLSRDQFDAASGDAARARPADTGAGQLGDQAAQSGSRDAPRYGGSGSLESRDQAGQTGSQARDRSQSYGGAAQVQSSNSSYSQLDRDAAARSGGNQSYQRRTQQSRSGMQRQPRAMPRRR
jgi:hypothetical protein